MGRNHLTGNEVPLHIVSPEGIHGQIELTGGETTEREYRSALNKVLLKTARKGANLATVGDAVQIHMQTWDVDDKRYLLFEVLDG